MIYFEISNSMRANSPAPYSWPSAALAPVTGYESIMTAVTESELFEVYRLRYRVYIEGQCKPYPADHKHRLLFDDLDATSAIWYTRDSEGAIDAAVRVNSGGDTNALAKFENEFSLAPFLSRACPGEIHFYSRLITIGTPGANRNLLRILRRCYIMQLQCLVRFIFCRTDRRLVPFFGRLGFVAYGLEWDDPIVGRQPCLVGLPCFVADLPRVATPIRELAPRGVKDHGDRMWLQEKFPSVNNSMLFGERQCRARVRNSPAK